MSITRQGSILSFWALFAGKVVFVNVGKKGERMWSLVLLGWCEDGLGLRMYQMR